MTLEFHPFANVFPLIEGDAFEALVADIKANGIREPIVLLDGKILDGRNRYRAGVAAGVINADGMPETYRSDRVEPVALYNPLWGDPLAFVISANLHRRHLDDGQRAMVATRLATLGHGGARVAKAESKGPIGPLGDEPPLPLGDPRPAMTQAAAAQALNVSVRQVKRARVVEQQGAPELVAATDAGRVAVSVAADLAKLPVEEQREVLRSASPTALYRVIKDQRNALTAQKKTKRAEKEKRLGAKQKALPQKKYGVIYADPAWAFKTRSEAGMDRAAANHYPVMTSDEICALPVRDIAADDCVLFLWATVPNKEDADAVMARWGFTYKSAYVWFKEGGAPGTGYWSRVDHENLLIGVRGNPPCPAPGTQRSSVIRAPAGRHSEKPACVRQMIEEYFPTLPKIELNARVPASDIWDVWGNEAPEAEEALPLLRPGVTIRASHSARDCVILSASERNGFWSLVCDDALSVSLRGSAYYNELTIADGQVTDPHGGTIAIIGFDPIAAEVLAERAQRGDGGRYRVFNDYGQASERGLQALKAAVESGGVAWSKLGDGETSRIVRLADGGFESPGRGSHHGAYPKGVACDGLDLSRRAGIVEVDGYWDGSFTWSGSTMPYGKVNAFLKKLATWRPAPASAPEAPHDFPDAPDDGETVEVPAFLRRAPAQAAS
jgi:N6-adenosine-specific RNA methylase IME4